LKAVVSTTVIARRKLLVLEPLPMVKDTRKKPVDANAWLGFWTVEVVPSPKSHCQEVGLPEELSVNWTTCPGVG
jgi:hypothetical protein